MDGFRVAAKAGTQKAKNQALVDLTPLVVTIARQAVGEESAGADAITPTLTQLFREFAGDDPKSANKFLLVANAAFAAIINGETSKKAYEVTVPHSGAASEGRPEQPKKGEKRSLDKFELEANLTCYGALAQQALTLHSKENAAARAA